MPELLKVKNISAGYQNFPVLINASFEIGQGEFFGIIGPNGSGKSTLLRVLSRCLKPWQGSVYYKKEDLYLIAQAQIAKEFAFVSQNIDYSFDFLAWEMVLMGRLPYVPRLQLETRHDAQIAKDALVATNTLELAGRQMHTLSAGEKQMVMISKALAQEPKVLFLDEPTAHLDIGHQIQVLNLLKRLNLKEKITVIAVLHDLNLASEYCGRMLLLEQGACFALGIASEVLTYQNIERVYKTTVVVNKNPISGKPHILLVPGKNS